MKTLYKAYKIDGGKFEPRIRLAYLHAKELGMICLVLCFLGINAKAQASTCPATMPHCAQLSWTAPAVDATHGAAVSYNVYHSLASGGCNTLTSSTCLKVGSTTAPTTSYTDGPLLSSTQYCYVITAVNATGEGPGPVVSCGTTGAGNPPNQSGSVVIQIF